MTATTAEVPAEAASAGPTETLGEEPVAEQATEQPAPKEVATAGEEAAAGGGGGPGAECTRDGRESKTSATTDAFMVEKEQTAEEQYEDADIHVEGVSAPATAGSGFFLLALLRCRKLDAPDTLTEVTMESRLQRERGSNSNRSKLVDGRYA